jgi:hypothetical protein
MPEDSLTSKPTQSKPKTGSVASAFFFGDVDVSLKEEFHMRTTSSFAALIFIVILGIGGGLAFAAYSATYHAAGLGIGVVAFVTAVVVALAIKVADRWDKAVILRLGKFHSLRGPGLFFIFPVIDTIPSCDRHARNHDGFQGGKNADQRHGAGGCGCGAVLESD